MLIDMMLIEKSDIFKDTALFVVSAYNCYCVEQGGW